ncbi:recombination-associated protein RdgC, partial [Aeromonas caviae]|uniref:recombination-associated protein RdgC n=1 Tax=Aeromonas caviae TaxID=648 RepID=UPI0038CF480D
YLNTTTKRPLNVVMHLLVKCMGSLKNQTIHIDNIKMGISNRLKDYLTDSAERPEALGPFSPLQFVKLKSADTAQEMVTFKGMDLNGDRASDVVSLLEAGYQVEELELWHEPISFKLNSDFSLRAISMPDYDSDDDADDYSHHWRQCNATNLILLSKAITDLCTMMDYQAPAEEQAA